MRIAAFIVQQHVELAAILWSQRELVLSSDGVPDVDARTTLSHRLEAHLDALVIAGEAAWPFILRQYEECAEDGELFVAAVHALRGRDAERIAHVVALARAAPCHEGLLGALAWLQPTVLASAVQAWRVSTDGFCRYLVVCAYLRHGADPGRGLATFLSDEDARVRAQGYRLVARLQRSDARDWVQAGMADADADVRLWAAVAGAEIGVEDSLEPLVAAVIALSPHAVAVLPAVLKALPTLEVRPWLNALAAAPATRALAVRGIGMIGGKEVLPWLVQRMGEPAVAACAAASFLKIWGPIQDVDDYFHDDLDDASEALGVEADVLQGRIPIAAKFALLIDGESLSVASSGP